jgi:hypothetical protein
MITSRKAFLVLFGTDTRRVRRALAALFGGVAGKSQHANNLLFRKSRSLHLSVLQKAGLQLHVDEL